MVVDQERGMPIGGAVRFKVTCKLDHDIVEPLSVDGIVSSSNIDKVISAKVIAAIASSN